MTSWKKASAAVGFSGLTPRKAARGALTCPEFQNMLDPLDRDPFGPVHYCTVCNFGFKMSNVLTH